MKTPDVNNPQPRQERRDLRWGLLRDALQIGVVLAFGFWLLYHFKHPLECVDIRYSSWGSECMTQELDSE